MNASSGAFLSHPENVLTRRRLLAAAGFLSASAAGLAASSACGLLPARTPAKMPLIGFLSAGPREAQADFIDPFLDGLRELGYIEGQTVTIEWRFTPAGSESTFSELADDLVRLPVDVIVTVSSTPASMAARRATHTIPIVASGVAYPVESGLVANLSRPGGNLTALAAGVVGLLGKKLELIREVASGPMHIVALVDATNPVWDVVGWDEIRTAAQQAGVHAERIDLRSAEDVEAAFAAAALNGANAIIDLQNPLLYAAREQVGALALQQRLPALFSNRFYVASGVLMSYSANIAAINHRAAGYVDKILKGTKPGDLPVERPTTFDLAVNVNTLQALGLTIPPSVLPLVTEWIQ